jgi:hemolysin activation/secretion protein
MKYCSSPNTFNRLPYPEFYLSRLTLSALCFFILNYSLESQAEEPAALAPPNIVYTESTYLEPEGVFPSSDLAGMDATWENLTTDIRLTDTDNLHPYLRSGVVGPEITFATDEIQPELPVSDFAQAETNSIPLQVDQAEEDNAASSDASFTVDSPDCPPHNSELHAVNRETSLVLGYALPGSSLFHGRALPLRCYPQPVVSNQIPDRFGIDRQAIPEGYGDVAELAIPDALQSGDEGFQRRVKDIISPFLGRVVSQEQLIAIKDEITRLYIQDGYLTSRAESVSVSDDGILYIQVIEGYIDPQHLRVTSPRKNPFEPDDDNQDGRAEPTAGELLANAVLQQYVLNQIFPAIAIPRSSLEPNFRHGPTARDHYDNSSLNHESSSEQSTESPDYFIRLPVNLVELEDYIRLLSLDPRFERDEVFSILSSPPFTDSPNPEAPPSGESWLEVQVREIPWELSLGFNNYSPPSLGELGFDWGVVYNGTYGDSLLRYGERFYAGGRFNPFVNTSTAFNLLPSDTEFGNDASTSWLLGYSLPTGRDVGEIDLQASWERKDVVEGNFRSIGFRSEIDRYGVSYRHPLERSFRREIALVFGMALEESRTFISKTRPFPVGQGPSDLGVSRTTVLSFAQEYIGRGDRNIFLVRSQFNLGTGLFDATSNPPPIPDGSFFSWFGQAQWLGRISENHTLAARAITQLTGDSLLPANQFVMGGAQSVRGYPQNIRAGDSGLVMSFEDRINVFIDGEHDWLDLQLIPFVDAGVVWASGRNPNLVASDNVIASTGISLQANFLENKNLRVRIDYGIPLINLPQTGNSLQDNGLFFGIDYVQPIY